MGTIVIERVSGVPSTCPYVLKLKLYPGSELDVPFTNVQVDWGDGQTETILFTIIWGFQYIEHTYDVAGTFTINFTFVSNGVPGTRTYTDYLTLTAPSLYFSSNIPAFANRTTSFVNLDVPSGGSADNGYEWDFGDGTPVSTIEDPTHTFSTIGKKFLEERFSDLSRWTNVNLATCSVSGNKLSTIALHNTSNILQNGCRLTDPPILYGNFDICITMEYGTDGRAGYLTTGEAYLLLGNEYDEIFAYAGLVHNDMSGAKFKASIWGTSVYESSKYGYGYGTSDAPIYIRITRLDKIISIYEKSSRTGNVWSLIKTAELDRSITRVMLCQVSNCSDLYPRLKTIWSVFDLNKDPGDSVFSVKLTAISDTNVRTSYTKDMVIKLAGITPSVSLLPATIYENDTITLTNNSLKGYAIKSSSYEINWDDGTSIIVDDFTSYTKLYKYYVGDKTIRVSLTVQNTVDGIADNFLIEIPIHIDKRSFSEPTSDFRLEHIGSNSNGKSHIYPINYGSGIVDPPSGSNYDGDWNRWGSYFDGRYVHQSYVCTNPIWTTLLSLVRIIYDTVTGTYLYAGEYMGTFYRTDLTSNSPLNIIGIADKSGVYQTIFEANFRNGLGSFVGIVASKYTSISSFSPVINDALIAANTKKAMGRVHPVSGKFYEIANKSWYYSGPYNPVELYQPSISVWEDDTSSSSQAQVGHKMIEYYDYNYLTGTERLSTFSSHGGIWLEFLDNNTIIVMMQLAGSSVPTETGILYQNYPFIINYLDINLNTLKTVFLEPECMNTPDQTLLYSHRFILFDGVIMFVTKTGDLAYISEEVPIPAQYNCPHVYTAKLARIRSKLSDNTYKNILYNIGVIDNEITCTIRKGSNRISQIHLFANVVNFISESSDQNAAHYWEFGDGGVSTLVSPTHAYSAPGKYTVTLKVTNGTESSTSTGIAFVSTPYPVVDIGVVWFDNNIVPARIGLESLVTLNDGMDEQIVSYQWTLDGVNIATTRNFDVYIAEHGDYLVNLTITNNYGKSTSSTETITVGYIPEAHFTPTKMKTTPALYPLSVQFNNTTVTDEVFAVTTWLWNFGDGTTSTEKNPLHQFTVPGTFDVTLTATNSYGSTVASGQIELIEWATMVEFFEIVRMQDAGRELEFSIASEIIQFIDKAINTTILHERVNIHGDRGPREIQGHDEHGIGHIVETINEFGITIRNAISEIGTHITQAITYKFRSGASEVKHIGVCEEMVLIDTNIEEQE